VRSPRPEPDEVSGNLRFGRENSEEPVICGMCRGRTGIKKIIKPKNPEEGLRSPKVAIAGFDWTGAARCEGATGTREDCERARLGGRRCFICLLFAAFLFRRAVATSDTSLYYVLCGKGCPTADGEVQGPRSKVSD
jgi:hypothetical protein